MKTLRMIICFPLPPRSMLFSRHHSASAKSRHYSTNWLIHPCMNWHHYKLNIGILLHHCLASLGHVWFEPAICCLVGSISRPSISSVWGLDCCLGAATWLRPPAKQTFNNTDRFLQLTYQGRGSIYQ